MPILAVQSPQQLGIKSEPLAHGKFLANTHNFFKKRNKLVCSLSLKRV